MLLFPATVVVFLDHGVVVKVQRLIQVAGLKALHKLVAAKALGNRHGITAGKARIAVAALGHDFEQALNRKEGQRIGADILANLVNRLVGADKLRLHVGIDTVEARPDDLGRVDADMNLLGAGVAQHLDELPWWCRARWSRR